MTTTWTEAPASTTNTYYDITGLGNNLSYQWQVRTVCSPTESSAYTNSDYIYTTCSAPAILTWTVLSPTSVRLEWSEAGPDVSYELRWRPYGAAGWTTVAALTGAAYSLTGLTTNVFYEWQLRTVCAGGQSSEFSYSRYFRPVSCTAMTTLKAGSWLDPAVWSCNRIPVSTDAVVVAHPVTVPVKRHGNYPQTKLRDRGEGKPGNRLPFGIAALREGNQTRVFIRFVGPDSRNALSQFSAPDEKQLMLRLIRNWMYKK